MSAVAAIAEATVTGMGFELVDAQVSGGGRLLRIFIDRPRGSGSGVTVDDCAEVSQQLSRVFAVEGIDYDRLEVSSPGLDRPLRKPADFARFAGRQVEIRSRLRDETGRRKYVGLLKGFAGNSAAVEVDGRTVTLELEQIERARLVPDLRKKEAR